MYNKYNVKEQPIQDIGTPKNQQDASEDAVRWLSMSEAALLTPYSAEYLSLLARKKKIASKKIGNAWYTTKEVLDAYMKRQMARTELANGGAQSVSEMVKSALEPWHTYGQDIRKYRLEQELATGMSPQVEHVERALERVLDKKISNLQFPIYNEDSKSKSESKIRKHFKIATSSKVLVAITLAAIVLFSVLPVPFVFSFVSRSVDYVKEAINDANTVMGFRPGTHANEILLLDKEGNVSIMGHIETEGQLRSYVADGIAPLVVDSTTTVKNLSADSVDNISAEEFTLAFVTKNGNMTTENVYFEGNVEVGETLKVRGATELLSTLEVSGKLKAFGEAEFRQAIEVLGPAYFESLVTLAGDAKIKGNLDVSKNITVRGSVESNSAIIGKSGSFGSLGVSGSFSAGGKITLGNEKDTLTINSKNVTIDSSGNASFDGGVSATSLSATDLIVTNATTTNFFTDVFRAALTTITSLIADDITTGALTATNSTSTNATSTNFYAEDATIDSLTTAEITITDLLFTRATGTSATTTNLFSSQFTSNNLQFTNGLGTYATITNATTTNFFSTIGRFTDLFSDNFDASSFTFVNATGTNATTTSSFAETASSTNLFSTNFNLGTGSLGYATISDLIFTRATGTSATTTSFFSTTASSTNLFSSLLSVGGTQGLNVIAGGNVGIGTTAPTGALDVYPSGGGSATLGNSLSVWALGGGANGIYAQLGLGYKGTNGVPPGVIAWQANTNNAYQGDLVFALRNTDSYTAAPVQMMTIKPSGNVGIGTTGPVSALQVNSEISVGATDNDRGIISYTAGSTDTLGFGTRSDSTNYFDTLNIKQGNVGIGTTGPNEKLDVNGAIEVRGTTAGYGATSNVGMVDNGVGLRLLSFGDASNFGVISFYSAKQNNANGTERMRIDNQGNVGIGTTGPSGKLHVAGTLSVGSAVVAKTFHTSWDGGIIQVGLGGSIFSYDGYEDLMIGSNYYINSAGAEKHIGAGKAANVYVTNGNINFRTTDTTGAADDTITWTNAMTIKSTGNVGIGTTNPLQKLHVEGQCVTGDTLLPIRRRRKNRKGKKENGEESLAGKAEGNIGSGTWDYLMVRIADIQPGDEVLSLNKNNGLVEYHSIKGLMDMGVKKVYELKTKSGRVIRTTSTHPYLVAPVQKLRSKSRPVSLQNFLIKIAKRITNNPVTPKFFRISDILTPYNRDIEKVENENLLTKIT